MSNAQSPTVMAHQTGVDSEGVEVMARRSFSAPAKLDASLLSDLTKLAFNLSFDQKTLFDVGLRDIDPLLPNRPRPRVTRGPAARRGGGGKPNVGQLPRRARPELRQRPFAAACADPLFATALFSASALDGVWTSGSLDGDAPLALALRAEAITCGTFAKKPFAVMGFTRGRRTARAPKVTSASTPRTVTLPWGCSSETPSQATPASWQSTKPRPERRVSG